MSTIDYSHLKYLAVFATIVECGSFAAAARKLQTSRSRVSEQIGALEISLNLRLIQRSTRKLSITSEGSMVYERARVLPSLLQDIQSICSSDQPSGRVTMTMGHDVANKFIVDALSAFEREYPDISLDLIIDDSALNLIDDQFDLGIRVGFPKDDAFVAHVLHEECFSLYASPDYVERFNCPETIVELIDAQWVLIEQVSERARSISLRVNKELRDIRPKHFHMCNSPLMVQNMVKAGLGIAALLPSTVKAEVERGDLVQVMPEVTSDPFVFSLIYPSRKQIPKRTRVLIDYLVNADLFD